MTAARIYVDLDDVLAETAETFLRVLDERFGKRMSFEQITNFDLGASFDLDEDGLASFLEAAHQPRVLESIRPMPGAAETVGDWIERGFEVVVVTGRPPSTEGLSRSWLSNNRIPHSSLRFVDKYSRLDPFDGGHGAAVPALDEISLDGFRLAVEDNLEIAARLSENPSLAVVLFDRPWNRDVSRQPAEALRRITRCNGWNEIRAHFRLEPSS